MDPLFFLFSHFVAVRYTTEMSLPAAHLLTHSNIIPKTSFSHTHSVCTLSLSTCGLWCGQGRVHAKEACLHKTFQREPLKEHTVPGKGKCKYQPGVGKTQAHIIFKLHMGCAKAYKYTYILYFNIQTRKISIVCVFQLHLNLHG